MKKEDKPKEKLSFVSYKNHIIIFGASHYWIFLTHNTSKLRNSAQNHTHIYIYIHINSTHHLIQLVAFKPVQSAWKSKSYTCGETDWMVWVDRAGWYRGPIWPLLLQHWIYWWNTFLSNHPRMQHYNKSYQILIFWMWISLSVTVTN